MCAPRFFQRHRKRLRIATKYVSLTRAFFAGAGIWDYRIVESAGATEGAPASGAAEAIVDITTTGATLAANNLKTLEDGTILQSRAQLAAGLGAAWTAEARQAARKLITRLAAREKAKASLVLRTRLGAQADAVLAKLAAAAGASVLSRPPADNADGEYSLLCARQDLMNALAILRDAACHGAVTAHDTDYVFDQDDPLVAALDAALPR